MNKENKIYYIGSKDGIENEIISYFKDVKYYSIHVGKLRRYASLKNLTDFFNVFTGIKESYKLIKKIKPDIIFSKGGFVSFPVVVGGWLNRVPVIIHESDISLGLANKLSFPFCTKILTTFDIVKNNKKIIHVGAVVREDLKKGIKSKGLAFCNFKNNKPIILITGGSQGSKFINNIVRNNLNEITKKFNIIHLCGKNNIDKNINNKNYKQYEFIMKELPDLFACTDICVTRGGANTIFECLSVNIPMIIIPLGKDQSRGDQILNAIYFEKKGYCKLIYEKDFSSELLLREINYMYKNIDKIKNKISKSAEMGTIENIVKIIENNKK